MGHLLVSDSLDQASREEPHSIQDLCALSALSSACPVHHPETMLDIAWHPVRNHQRLVWRRSLM
jgi:hypothetical protein